MLAVLHGICYALPVERSKTFTNDFEELTLSSASRDRAPPLSTQLYRRWWRKWPLKCKRTPSQLLCAPPVVATCVRFAVEFFIMFVFTGTALTPNETAPSPSTLPSCLHLLCHSGTLAAPRGSVPKTDTEPVAMYARTMFQAF